MLDKEWKEKTTPRIREYLRQHPDCKYGELIKALGIKTLSKPWFYTLRSEFRKKTQEVKGAGRKKGIVEPAVSGRPPSIMTVEILESIDSSGFNDELKGVCKTYILPLLKKLMPDGPSLQMVFLADPPKIEIRRMIA